MRPYTSPIKGSFFLSTLVFIVLVPSIRGLDCDHPECKEEAMRLLNTIDERVNPCDDFAQFACGKQFEDQSPGSQDYKQSLETSFKRHLFNLHTKIKLKLDQPARTEDNRSIRLAKTYWQSCKQTQPKEALAGIHLVFHRLGGWPLLQKDWQEQHFNWAKFSTCARIIGFLPKMFVHIGLNLDDLDKPWSPNDTLSLTVERAKFMYRRSDMRYQMARAEEFFQIAVHIKGDRRPTLREIQDALQLGKKIHLLTHSQNSPIVEQRQMSIAQLQKDYPFVNWMDYLRSMLTRRQANYLSDRNCVIVEPCFLSQIGALLEKTSKRIQANYGFLAIIDDLMQDVRPHLNLTYANSVAEVEGICFKSVAATFGSALDMIVAKMAGPANRTKVTEMQLHIAQEGHRIFHRIPWMDHQTQLHAAKKSEKTTFINVYKDDTFDDRYYDRLEFTQPDAILVVMRQLNIFLVDHYYLLVGRERNMYALQRVDNETTNAIYRVPFAAREPIVRPERISNQVYTPAGALGVGRFSTLPQLDFMNYAVLGLQIAVAIGHHVYQRGSFIDCNAQWRKHSWWSQSTQKSFFSRTPCRQVAPLTSIDELSPIFGYIGAAEISYKAMFNSVPEKNGNTTLPGLKYNTRQLFWIAAVSGDCDTHLKHRYNMMVAHNGNFATDFKCPANSKMNTLDKCKMWIP